MRYIYSPYAKNYHDRFHLTEKCNTDQLKRRQESDTIPEGKSYCKLCAANEAAEKAAG